MSHKIHLLQSVPSKPTRRNIKGVLTRSGLERAGAFAAGGGVCLVRTDIDNPELKVPFCPSSSIAFLLRATMNDAAR
jgi:hypothetical protein